MIIPSRNTSGSPIVVVFFVLVARSITTGFTLPTFQATRHNNNNVIRSYRKGSWIGGRRRRRDSQLLVLSPSSPASASAADEEDDEWHPHDPASTTPQLLAGVWDMIAQGSTMSKGDTYTVMYTQMKDKLNTPKYMNIFLAHLDSCKDVCDHFGITTTLVPYTEKGTGTIVGFTVKSYRDPNKDPDSMYDFEYDPFWDDVEIPDYSGVDDEAEGRKPKEGTTTATTESSSDGLPEIVNKIPTDDDEIINITKVWVNKVMSDMGICPFTSGPDLAGLPIGPVYYCVDRSTLIEDMYAKYWKEVVRVEQEDDKDLSTTLLIAPEFYIDNVELFESWSNTLTQPLSALGVEELLQLVFFHPDWSFRDGGARAGGGQAANYARRSPWPMINILRTKQVRAAQRGIPTGLVYKQNEKTLGNVGVEKLEKMLRRRNWDEVKDVKVNRREIEALRVAQEFQETGIVKEKDTSLAFDATPAANKVDSQEIEEGNLMNVILDALRKRLGKDGNNNNHNNGQASLSGPETSATIMASDIILKELQRVVKKGPTTAAATTTTVDVEKEESSTITTSAAASETFQNTDDEYKKAKEEQKSQRMEAARKAIMDDYQDPNSHSSSSFFDDEYNAMVGKGGMTDDGDHLFSEGNDPRNFY